MNAPSNIRAGIGYDDLREWLSYAERLGEVRVVKGASWQEDIGLAAEAVLRAENGPCVVFEEIPGRSQGFPPADEHVRRHAPQHDARLSRII